MSHEEAEAECRPVQACSVVGGNRTRSERRDCRVCCRKDRRWSRKWTEIECEMFLFLARKFEVCSITSREPMQVIDQGVISSSVVLER